jgi:hypothetical protein
MQIRMTLLVAGATLCGLAGLPETSYAATGCTDAHLNGTYNVQVENSSIVSVLASLKATPSPEGGTVLPPPPTGGFGNNPNSLGGQVPGLGRFFFDGAGRIVGQAAAANGSSQNVIVGSYSVNLDCTASFKLNTGQSFNAVVAAGGDQALFMQTDGVSGKLTRAANSCTPTVGTNQSFAFSLSGARRATVTSTPATGTTTTTPTATVAFTPYSTLGSVSMSPDGTFVLRGWSFTGSATEAVTANGTYNLGFDCSLKLNFGSDASAATPLSLRGFLVDQQAGILSVQPDASNILTTSLIVQ